MKNSPGQCTRKGKSIIRLRRLRNDVRENDRAFEDTQITQCVFLGVLRLRPVPSVIVSNSEPSVVKSKRFKNNNSTKESNKNLSKVNINKCISSKAKQKISPISLKKQPVKKHIDKVKANMPTKNLSLDKSNEIPNNDSKSSTRATVSNKNVKTNQVAINSPTNPVQNLFNKLKQELDDKNNIVKSDISKEILFSSGSGAQKDNSSNKRTRRSQTLNHLNTINLLSNNADDVIVINEEVDKSKDIPNNSIISAKQPRRRRSLLSSLPPTLFEAPRLLRSELAQKNLLANRSIIKHENDKIDPISKKSFIVNEAFKSNSLESNDVVLVDKISSTKIENQHVKDGSVYFSRVLRSDSSSQQHSTVVKQNSISKISVRPDSFLKENPGTETKQQLSVLKNEENVLKNSSKVVPNSKLCTDVIVIPDGDQDVPVQVTDLPDNTTVPPPLRLLRSNHISNEFEAENMTSLKNKNMTHPIAAQQLYAKSEKIKEAPLESYKIPGVSKTSKVIQKRTRGTLKSKKQLYVLKNVVQQQLRDFKNKSVLPEKTLTSKANNLSDQPGNNIKAKYVESMHQQTVQEKSKYITPESSFIHNTPTSQKKENINLNKNNFLVNTSTLTNTKEQKKQIRKKQGNLIIDSLNFSPKLVNKGEKAAENTQNNMHFENINNNISKTIEDVIKAFAKDNLSNKDIRVQNTFSETLQYNKSTTFQAPVLTLTNIKEEKKEIKKRKRRLKINPLSIDLKMDNKVENVEMKTKTNREDSIYKTIESVVKNNTELLKENMFTNEARSANTDNDNKNFLIPQIPRKRGRPKQLATVEHEDKVINEDSNNDTKSPLVTQMPRKRGRPKPLATVEHVGKVINEDSNNESKSLLVTQMPRKRGRPKQLATVEHVDNVVNDSNNESKSLLVTQMPRKRQFKHKRSKISILARVITRKRGRTGIMERGSTQKSSTIPNNSFLTKIIRKRGRPKRLPLIDKPEDNTNNLGKNCDTSIVLANYPKQSEVFDISRLLERKKAIKTRSSSTNNLTKESIAQNDLNTNSLNLPVQKAVRRMRSNSVPKTKTPSTPSDAPKRTRSTSATQTNLGDKKRKILENSSEIVTENKIYERDDVKEKMVQVKKTNMNLPVLDVKSEILTENIENHTILSKHKVGRRRKEKRMVSKNHISQIRKRNKEINKLNNLVDTDNSTKDLKQLTNAQRKQRKLIKILKASKNKAKQWKSQCSRPLRSNFVLPGIKVEKIKNEPMEPPVPVIERVVALIHSEPKSKSNVPTVEKPEEKPIPRSSLRPHKFTQAGIDEILVISDPEDTNTKISRRGGVSIKSKAINKNNTEAVIKKVRSRVTSKTEANNEVDTKALEKSKIPELSPKKKMKIFKEVETKLQTTNILKKSSKPKTIRRKQYSSFKSNTLIEVILTELKNNVLSTMLPSKTPKQMDFKKEIETKLKAIDESTKILKKMDRLIETHQQRQKILYLNKQKIKNSKKVIQQKLREGIDTKPFFMNQNITNESLPYNSKESNNETPVTDRYLHDQQSNSNLVNMNSTKYMKTNVQCTNLESSVINREICRYSLLDNRAEKLSNPAISESLSVKRDLTSFTSKRCDSSIYDFNEAESEVPLRHNAPQNRPFYMVASTSSVNDKVLSRNLNLTIFNKNNKSEIISRPAYSSTSLDSNPNLNDLRSQSIENYPKDNVINIDNEKEILFNKVIKKNSSSLIESEEDIKFCQPHINSSSYPNVLSRSGKSIQPVKTFNGEDRFRNSWSDEEPTNSVGYSPNAVQPSSSMNTLIPIKPAAKTISPESNEKKSPLKQITITEMFNKSWTKPHKTTIVRDLMASMSSQLMPIPNAPEIKEDNESDTESKKEWIPEEYAEYKMKYSALRQNQNSKLRCKICLVICDSYYKLIKHRKTHEEKQRPHVCTICRSEFGNVENFSAHLRLHKGQYPYVCRKCEEGFWTKNDYDAHASAHSVQKMKSLPKKYRCDVCLKEFARRSEIEKHTRIHTGEKPCICNICNKRFTGSYTLSKHLLTHLHIKPFVCEICDKQFGRHDSLKRHLLTHSVKKPLKCSVCFKGFIRMAQLSSHMRSKHPDVPFEEVDITHAQSCN